MLGDKKKKKCSSFCYVFSKVHCHHMVCSYLEVIIVQKNLEGIELMVLQLCSWFKIRL